MNTTTDLLRRAAELLEHASRLLPGMQDADLVRKRDACKPTAASLLALADQMERAEPVAKGECWPESVMRRWDYWRAQIASGDTSSGPRDWFESLAPANNPALEVTMSEGLHPRTADLVRRFASALAEKLHAAEQKYGYTDAWAQPDWMDECRAALVEHVRKGDPRDVAAYCAFLWHHGERTELPAPEVTRDAEPMRCHAGRDGDCTHPDCPQLRDGEPVRSGRDCPLDVDASGCVLVPANTVALVMECRDALAEELAAWDINPPLHHVKQAHDRCKEWLAAAPQPGKEKGDTK